MAAGRGQPRRRGRRATLGQGRWPAATGWSIPPPLAAEPPAEAIPLVGALRGRPPDRHRQAGRHGRPSGARQPSRHPGQRPARPLRRQPLGHRRRGAAGHRPPAGQGHLRRDGRRQDRRRAPRPRRPCSRAHDIERVYLALTRGAPRARPGTDRHPHRPLAARPQEDGGAARPAGARRSPTTRSSATFGPAPSRWPRGSPAAWRPAAPTRSASTWPICGAPCLGDPALRRRRARAAVREGGDAPRPA